MLSCCINIIELSDEVVNEFDYIVCIDVCYVRYDDDFIKSVYDIQL